MAQQPPLIEQLHNEMEHMFRRFYVMTEDGEVSDQEQEEVLDTLDALTILSELAMKAQAAGVAMMRLGPESTRATRLVRHIEVNHGDAA